MPDYNLVGWEPLPVADNDTVLELTKQLIQDYQVWLKEHPSNTVENEALHKYLELHESFSKNLTKLGVTLPNLDYDQLLRSYRKSMNPLSEYLANIGWFGVFIAPFSETTQPDSRAIVSLFVSKLYSRKEIAVETHRGESISCTINLLDNSQKFGVSKSTYWGLTIGTEVSIMLGPRWEEAQEMRRIQNKRNLDEERTYYQLQWEELFRKLGGRAPFIEQVINDSTNCTIEHELQHVRDRELMSYLPVEEITLEHYGQTRETQLTLHGFAEARALIRPLVTSTAPLYYFGHILNWAKSTNIVWKMAATMAHQMLGNFTPSTRTEELSEQLRAAGQRVMKDTDKFYDLLLTHMRDPDPFRVTMDEWNKSHPE